jgi:protein-disulfide isomerase
MKMSKKHIIVFAISLILIILVILIYQYSSKSDKQIVKVVETLLEQRDMDIVFGNDSAQLTMFVFASYQCHFCRKFFDSVFPLLDKKYIQSNQLKIIYRPTANILGGQRETALKTLVCLNKYGNFTYFHKLLLSNFKVMFTEEFKKMVDGFKEKDPFVGECIDGTEGKKYLLSNIEEFNKLEFKGTPTFVLKNNVYIGYRSFEQMQEIIDKLLVQQTTSNINY